MGFRHWFRSSRKPKTPDISLELETTATHKKEQIARLSAILAAKVPLADTEKTFHKQNSAGKAHVDSVTSVLRDSQAPNCAAAPPAETYMTNSNATTPTADVLPDNDSDFSFIIIDGLDEGSKQSQISGWVAY